MTDLSPYEVRTPLSGGARFIRGFKRIGLAFAGISLIVGAGCGIFPGLQQQGEKVRAIQQAVCIRNLQQHGIPLKTTTYNANLIDLYDNGCWGPDSSNYLGLILRKAEEKQPAPLEYVLWPAFVGVAAGAGVGALLYVVFWLFGWLCAGFTRD